MLTYMEISHVIIQEYHRMRDSIVFCLMLKDAPYLSGIHL